MVQRSKLLTDSEPSPASHTGSKETPSRLQLSETSNGFATTLYLDEASRKLFLRANPSSSTQTKWTLYGMVLENYHQRGILYHSIGVNGATFEDFNESEHFMAQIAELQPDLVIISLGTNETVNRPFPVQAFYQEVDQLMHGLEQQVPHAEILLTTPPDALRARRYPNSAISQAQEILLSYSLGNDLACWDLYRIMGGAESVNAWHQVGLAQGDRLHFTRKGYEFQGALLVEAILNGYGSFRAVK
ncbi:MAG: GDSL-type esterase/lipase family protein [Bacteroidota bacterium]